MLLGSVNIPDLKEKSSTDEKLRSMLECIIALQKQLQFVLQNLDTDNMSVDLSSVLEDAKVAAEGLNSTVKQDDFESYVTQTAQLISTKVAKNGVISSINQTPELITIQAPRISLEGLVTVNGDFKIDENGSMTATGGSIAGWTVSDGALYTGTNDATVSPQLYLGTADVLKATQIGTSEERADWRIKIGSNFGVASDGTVYAQAGEFRGNVNAGNIDYGNKTVNNISIHCGTFSGAGLTDGTVGPAKFTEVYATLGQFNDLKADVAYINKLLAGYANISLLRVNDMYYAAGGSSYYGINFVSAGGHNVMGY